MPTICLICGIQATLVPEIQDSEVLCSTVALAIGVFDFMTSTFPSYTDEASNRWVYLELLHLLAQHCCELLDNALIGHSTNNYPQKTKIYIRKTCFGKELGLLVTRQQQKKHKYFLPCLFLGLRTYLTDHSSVGHQ